MRIRFALLRLKVVSSSSLSSLDSTTRRARLRFLGVLVVWLPFRGAPLLVLFVRETDALLRDFVEGASEAALSLEVEDGTSRDAGP